MATIPDLQVRIRIVGKGLLAFAYYREAIELMAAEPFVDGHSLALETKRKVAALGTRLDSWSCVEIEPAANAN